MEHHGFTVSLRIKGDKKMQGLQIEVDKQYPQVPVRVQLLDNFGVTGTLLEEIKREVAAKVQEKGTTKYASMTSVIRLVFYKLGG